MSVSLDAFQISGGVILFLFALTMIFGDGKPEQEKNRITDYKHVTIFPIAIPSIASPGAIMAVILMTNNHIYTIQQQAITTGIVLIVICITLLNSLNSKPLTKENRKLWNSVLSKIMGLILASYAVQSILSGISNYFVNV